MLTAFQSPVILSWLTGNIPQAFWHDFRKALSKMNMTYLVSIMRIKSRKFAALQIKDLQRCRFKLSPFGICKLLILHY